MEEYNWLLNVMESRLQKKKLKIVVDKCIEHIRLTYSDASETTIFSEPAQIICLKVTLDTLFNKIPEWKQEITIIQQEVSGRILTLTDENEERAAKMSAYENELRKQITGNPSVKSG